MRSSLFPRLRPLLTALFVTLLAGTATHAPADDTEIYLGGDALQAARAPKANILLLLDTSGSMSTLVEDGDGNALNNRSRMDTMKQAVQTILAGLNNVNVGLMRFTDPGGPILFPVAGVDEDAAAIEGGGGGGGGAPSNVIDLRPAVGTDDAEERDPTGAVTTTATTLTLGAVAIAAQTGSIDVRTAASADDADEVIATGETQATSGNNILNFNRDQVNGLRFPGIAIPQGATITSATLSVTAQANDSSNFGSDGLRFRAHAIDNAPQFANDANNLPANATGSVGTRTLTTAQAVWTPPNFVSNTSYSFTSANLAAVVQEVVSRPGWTSGNAIAFVQRFTNSASSATRDVHSHEGAGGTASRRPRLQAAFSLAASSQDQTIGLRFPSAAIPQGARIVSARLTFTAAATNADALTLEFAGDDSADAATFATATSNVSSRSDTDARVTWDSTDEQLASWTVDQQYQSPDLSPIVQEIIDRDDFCGLNAIALTVRKTAGTGQRVAYSQESGTTLMPVLNVVFDTSDIEAGEGCLDVVQQYQIVASNDDAEESASTVNITSTQYDIRSSQTNGLRFRSVNIPPGSTIEDARVIFTVRSTTSGAAAFAWQYEDNLTPAPFSTTARNITNRTRVTCGPAESSPSGQWSPVDRQITSGNIAACIQAIIDKPGWEAGNDLALFNTATSGDRRARTYDDTPSKAPILVVRVQSGGPAIAPLVTTVRDRISDLVDGLPASGFTPIVGQLFEGVSYLRGDPVFHGKERGHLDAINTRISNPASWTGGTVVRDPACTDAFPQALLCADEHIEGDATYISPVNVSCHPTHIVLLTDGEANHNGNDDGVDHGRSQVESLVGGACITGTGNANVQSTSTSIGTGERCGRDLAAFIQREDQRPEADLPGDQTFKLHTIGFNLCEQTLVFPIDGAGSSICCQNGTASDSNGDGVNDTCGTVANDPASVRFLKDLATNGGGFFNEARTAPELIEVFNTIIAGIRDEPATFAAAATAVNSFNRLENKNDIYLALFKPTTKGHWRGNIKRYQICREEDADDDGTPENTCDGDEILDVNGNEAVGEDGSLLATARSFWSDVVDGADIEVGGMQDEVPLYSERNIYTFLGDYDSIGDGGDLIDTNANRISPDEAFEDNISAALLEIPSGDDDERLELLAWITGQDVDDEPRGNPAVRNGVTDENRYVMGDPLHASPIVVGLGGNEDDPVEKLITASNDGTLRILNATTGEEEFVWIPRELLPLQKRLRTNAEGPHLYGLDLTPSLWVRDVGVSGQIEPSEGDFVRLVVGQRDGGDNYWALDITPSEDITTSTTSGNAPTIRPRLLWHISGGTEEDPDNPYANLGLTWSQPVVTRMNVEEDGTTALRTVVVFGGGNDETLDRQFGPGSIGNIIYVADALTGELITSIGGDDTIADLVIDEMDYPFAATVNVFDADGDQSADRIYAGDLGGNMWRIDLPDVVSYGSTGGDVGVVGRLASISLSPMNPAAVPGDHAEPTRKFYSRPAVTQVRDSVFSDEPNYDLVLVGSGTRPNPLNQATIDYFWAFRDYQIEPLTDDDADGRADGYETIDNFSELTDVTDNPFQLDEDGVAISQAIFDETQEEIRTRLGWYVNLAEIDTNDDRGNVGQKVLSAATVVRGAVLFTTYTPVIPDDIDETCVPDTGFGRLYGLNALSGAALFADFSDQGDDNLSGADRAQVIGAGIPSDVNTVFIENDLKAVISTGGGALTPTLFEGLPVERTYWFQQ